MCTVYAVSATHYKGLSKKKNFHQIRVDESILDEPISLSELHDNVKIIDNRHIKNRVDDVLVVYKF